MSQRTPSSPVHWSATRPETSALPPAPYRVPRRTRWRHPCLDDDADIVQPLNRHVVSPSYLYGRWWPLMSWDGAGGTFSTSSDCRTPKNLDRASAPLQQTREPGARGRVQRTCPGPAAWRRRELRAALTSVRPEHRGRNADQRWMGLWEQAPVRHRPAERRRRDAR